MKKIAGKINVEKLIWEKLGSNGWLEYIKLATYHSMKKRHLKNNDWKIACLINVKIW